MLSVVHLLLTWGNRPNHSVTKLCVVCRLVVIRVECDRMKRAIFEPGLLPPHGSHLNKYFSSVNSVKLFMASSCIYKDV